MNSARLNDIFTKYTASVDMSNTQTVKFDIGTIFETKVTCEGIQANLDDVVPIFIEIIKTSLKQIPAYALKQITGYDLTSPAGFADFAVDVVSFALCAVYSLGVITGEQALRTTTDYLDKLYLTYSTENQDQGGTVQGGAGESENEYEQEPATNDNARERSMKSLLESASEEFSSKLNKCMDGMKKMYNEVIKAKIKNFKPYKVEKRKSFCEMMKTYEKTKPATELSLKSPIRFHPVGETKAKEKVCYKNLMFVSCKDSGDKTLNASVRLNTDTINKILNDDGKLLKISNTPLAGNMSLSIEETGKKILNVFTDCINDPNNADFCEELSCEGTSANLDTDCQSTPPAIPLRKQAIPFSFMPVQKCLSTDTTHTPPTYYEGDICHDSCPCGSPIISKMTRMQEKKAICLQFEIMTTAQRRLFLEQTLKVISSDTSTVKELKGVYNNIFEDFIIKDFCKYQMEQQINDFELYERNKFKTMEKETINYQYRNQIGMSRIQDLKADFTPGRTAFDGYVDMCTWYQSGQGNSSYAQDFTTVLKYDETTNTYTIEKVDLSTWTTTDMDNIAHSQPLYPVFGVCANSDCSQMKCVYDCRNWNCDNGFPTELSGTGVLQVNNTNIATELTQYKANTAENRKQEPDEVRAKKQKENMLICKKKQE